MEKKRAIKLFVAFQRGRLYIQLFVFLGIVEVIKNQRDWSDLVYLFLIPGIIIFCIIIGLLDMKFILREEVLQRNPIFNEILKELQTMKEKSPSVDKDNKFPA